jgi:hypothetical protein
MTAPQTASVTAATLQIRSAIDSYLRPSHKGWKPISLIKTGLQPLSALHAADTQATSCLRRAG